ncbi:MAG TPA: hypothetical protein VNB23_09340 [Ramlibacter sp.]|nr:hypothetical protein [Ramlibacter sp.]
MKLDPDTALERSAPAGLLRWEGVLLCALALGLLLAMPVSLGAMGLGTDALNHHIYLGWTAEQHRFDRDWLGAGFQSFQSPYLYWPMYRMAVLGWTGTAAGVAHALLHVVAVWPVWMLARTCLPGPTVFDVAMRALAVALALLSSVVLSAFGSTMTDVLGAAPLVWAVALAMQPVARGNAMTASGARRYVIVSGVCAGLAVGLKLGNGPLALGLPVLWLLCAGGWRHRLVTALLGGVATLLAFLAVYGHWGWMLWRHFGNPVYPFYDYWFAPLRAWLGVAG